MTPLKVLIAEDEPSMLSLVTRHVRGMGFTVVEAGDGDTAWELAQAHTPDLVILDVMMPGMSGWEVCKRVKSPAAAETFGSTGVIMLTGIGENLNEMTSPLFAADTWLNKPFDFADLEARIRETLAKYGKIAPLPGSHAADRGELPQAKPPVKRAAAKKKAPAKKAAAKKAPARKAPAKKAAAKRAPAKRAPAKRAPAKKAVAKRAPAKKAAAKKAPARKAPAKRAPARKAPAKKARAK
jgi:DNA-binding response OmpR family regulator